MLDLRFVRENTDLVSEALKKRGKDISLDEFIKLDGERREILYEAEQLKHKRNTVSTRIGELKRAGEDASEIISEMKEVSNKIKDYDERINEIEDSLYSILLGIPNIPHESVPFGKSEDDNVELRKWGEPRDFD